MSKVFANRVKDVAFAVSVEEIGGIEVDALRGEVSSSGQWNEDKSAPSTTRRDSCHAAKGAASSFGSRVI